MFQNNDDYISDLSLHDAASLQNYNSQQQQDISSSHGFLSSSNNNNSHKYKPEKKKSRETLSLMCYEALCVPKTISIGDYSRKSTPTSNNQETSKRKPISGISSTASSLNIDNFRAALLQEAVSATEVEKIFDDTRYHLFVDIGGNTLLNPRSTFMIYWQTINLFLTVLCLLVIPLEVAFSRDEMGLWFLIMGTIFESFFLLDFIINLNLPVQDKSSGFVIGDRKVIFYYYFRFWFWIDLLSALPFDIISLIIGDAQSNYKAGVFFASLRIVRILKVSVMSRMLRADLILSNLQGHVSYSHEQLQLFKLLFYIMVTIHSLACGLFLVAEVENAEVNWVEMNHIESSSTSTKYITAIYWAAMTATTIGYGDIVMITTIERAYSTFAMVIGASTYAFVTSRLVGMIIYGNRFKSRYSDIRSELLGLMQDIELPMVYRAIAGDFLFHWYHTRQRYDSQELLQVMSPQLRGLISQHMHGEWIDSVPFLSLAKSKHELAAVIAMAVLHQMYMPGEYIIKQRDDCKALYVVDQGRLTRAGSGLMTTLDRFDYFGEEMILTNPGKAGYAVINGIRYSTLYVLTRERVFEIMVKFPELEPSFRKARIKIAFRRRAKALINKLIKHKKAFIAKNGFYNNISQLSTLQQNSFDALNGHDMSAMNGSGTNGGYLVPHSLSSPPISVTSPNSVDPFFSSKHEEELVGLRYELHTMVNALNIISQTISNISIRVDNIELYNQMAIEARSRSLSYSNGSDISSLGYLNHQQNAWQSDGVTSNIDALTTSDIAFSTDTTTNGSIVEEISNSFVGD